MTTLVRSIRSFSATQGASGWGFRRRALVVAALVVAISVIPDGWTIASGAMSEAYLAVSVFVAGTLALVGYAERGLKMDLGVWLDQHQKWQVPVATLLGAFPGCGGAIIAVTQYTRGYLSFGALVATLITTMGDAMFLLLAREPQTALTVLAVSMVAGVVTGLMVDRVHGANFLRSGGGAVKGNAHGTKFGGKSRPATTADRVWLCLIIPGAVIGALAAFQVEVDAALAAISGFDAGRWLGAAGALLALAMWASTGESRPACNADDVTCERPMPLTGQKVIDTTNFVTSWVVFAFVGYELLVAAAGVDLAQAFEIWAPLAPAMAILIGFIPGCGPQIVVTSMYLSGAMPMSAQLGNAIANDGDALLPAIAIAPKAAVVATLYSAIPAVLAAYGWYFWVEGGVF